MSKSLNSPTARILRSSRLFSLPPPLYPASVDTITASGLVKKSDTATLPYPTRQAITAPAASLHRGDWGLKRPLPDKTTKTSTPHVRINALDTLEHITDFDSAADHTRTLDKWQEMNIYMSRMEHSALGETERASRHKVESAFDGRHDRTAIRDYPPEVRAAHPELWAVNDEGRTLRRATRLRELSADIKHAMHTRWRTEGPWLPYFSETEFAAYVKRVAKNPKTRTEFRKFLESARRREKRTAAMQKFHGTDDATYKEALDRASEVDDEDLEQYILRLRDTHSDVGSQLSVLIQQFFDMPPHPDQLVYQDSSAAFISNELKRSLPGPPSTHASAGLSYIRNGARMENHPIHGPQLNKAPVAARVLKPRESALGTVSHAILGVGGVVVEDSNTKGYKDDTANNQSRTFSFDLETPGGTKIWVDAERAYIDPTGRIRMVVTNAEKEAVAVHTGEADPRFQGVDQEDENSLRARLKGIPVSPEVDLLRQPYSSPQVRKVETDGMLDQTDLQRFKREIKAKKIGEKRDKLQEGIVDLLSVKERRL